MMPGVVKYSVIIPAYNAENTIGRCLKSLTEQNRNDVEIIVVNDGSTDSTADIIQSFVDDNACVIYIYQENGGVSSARNNGLEYASGTFITFVDSDDYVTADYFQKLDGMDSNADLCYFQCRTLGEKRQQETGLFDQINSCIEWVDKMRLLLSSRVIMHPVNKRFKRQIIENNKVRFIENLHISEDFNFCLAYSIYCSKIKTYNDSIYCVDITNKHSLSRKTRPNLTIDIDNGFHYAAATIKASGRDEFEKRQLLSTLDYLYIKNACTCIAETFKYCEPHYIKNAAEYRKICRTFRDPLGCENVYCSFVHHGLRFLLAHNLTFPFYIVTRAAKEHKFKRYRTVSTQ